MQKTRIICILSMHRSGSSMVANILQENGIALGDSLVGRSTFNKEGHFEDRFIVGVNKKILLYLGGSWDHPVVMPSNWFKYPYLRKLLQKTRKYYDEKIRGKEIFAFKDPRTCLTVPFWQSAFGKMHYIIILREPKNVVKSIMTRNNKWLAKDFWLWRMNRFLFHLYKYQGAHEKIRFLTAEEAFRLWEFYNHQIAGNCFRGKRLIVEYEKVISRPKEQIKRIMAFCNPQKQSVNVDAVKVLLNHGDSISASHEFKKMLSYLQMGCV